MRNAAQHSGPRYLVHAWGPTTPHERGLTAAVFSTHERDQAVACADRLTDQRLQNRRAEVWDRIAARVVYRSERDGPGQRAGISAGFVLAASDILRPRGRRSGMAERC